MSIRDIAEKIKSRLGEREFDLWLLLVIVLLATLGYGLRRLSELEAARQPVQIVQMAATSSSGAGVSPSPELGKYVASRSGEKYHLPWCSGAKRIKEGNKVWFDSEQAARAAGFAPAANCPGLSEEKKMSPAGARSTGLKIN